MEFGGLARDGERRDKRRGKKGGTQKGWGWLVDGSGYRVLITIGGIGKMYDNVYIGFNPNVDYGRSV
jgi:hypothetical protein